MLFTLIYQPSFGFTDGWIEKWGQRASFCLPLISAIELGTLLISRTILCFSSFKRSLTALDYWVWMGAEFIIACLFSDLLLSLYFQLNYLDTLPPVLLVGFALNIFPYTIAWQFIARKEVDNRLKDALGQIDDLRRNGGLREEGAIRFADDKGFVKLVVGADRVISIESAGNYVKILYDDEGRLMRYSLRNTLKGIEDVCSANSLVRCHRSFFVNVNKIKIIRRTSEGTFAEIDHAGVDNIPISKTYSSELVALFGG